MAPSSTAIAAVKSQPGLQTALGLCVGALRRIVEYELDPGINRRLRQLGERKERLDEGEHDELMSLVAFTETRSVEKLQAQLALKRLGEILPEVVEQH